MKSSTRTVAFLAAFLLTPTLAFAGPHDLFKKPAAKPAAKVTAPAPGAITNPGLFFTLKNDCTGAAAAAVADNVCLLAIDTAVYMTKLRAGDVAKGYSEDFNICAPTAGGNGEIMFVPSPGEAKAAVVVTVKPNSVVAYPKSFCK